MFGVIRVKVHQVKIVVRTLTNVGLTRDSTLTNDNLEKRGPIFNICFKKLVKPGSRMETIIERGIDTPFPVSLYISATELKRRTDSQGSSTNNCGNFSETAFSQNNIFEIGRKGQRISNYLPPAACEPSQTRIKVGERADCQSEFTRAVGGYLSLDRKHHTTRVQTFTGAKTTCTHVHKVLLDTGSRHLLYNKKFGKKC